MRKETNTLSPSPKGFLSPKFSDSDFREVRGLGLGRPKSSALTPKKSGQFGVKTTAVKCIQYNLDLCSLIFYEILTQKMIKHPEFQDFKANS
jgi:hypothetical protein